MRAWIRGFVIGLLSLLPLGVEAATHVALHATTEEIAIWLTRRSGHAYSADWSGSNRILARADAYKASPSSTAIWPGNTSAGAWNGDTVRDCGTSGVFFPGGSYTGDCAGNNGRAYYDRLRDSAFVYMLYANSGDSGLISQATSYRDPVRTHLLAQAAATGTDFSNTTKWPASYELKDKDFHIAIWLRKIVYAYSYIRPSLSGGDQATIDAFFLKAGQYWDAVIHNDITEIFPNRYSDDYTTLGSCTPSNIALTHFGGHMTRNCGGFWDNKFSNMNAAVAAIAVTLPVSAETTTLKAHAKRFVKEFVLYGTFSTGTIFDQVRSIILTCGSNPDPGCGYLYAASTIGSNVSAADHLARAGDLEPYTFSTSSGLASLNTTGGPKSIGTIIRRLADMQQHNVNVHASPDATLTECERIDDVQTGCTGVTVHRIIHDVGIAQANVFYKDTVVEAAVSRTPHSSPTSGGYDAFGGDWGHLPGARFMFGGMGALVDPYTGGGGGGGPTCPASAVCVSSGSDDAEERVDTSATLTTGQVLEFANLTGGTPNNLVGLRYQNIPIPQGATCDSATIAFTPIVGTTGTGTPTVTIRDQTGFAATTFADGTAIISGRTLSGTTPVSWPIGGTWTSGTVDANSTTPNLCSLLQPKINDVAWDELDNEVAFVFTYSSGTGFRAAQSLDAGANSPLTVAYTPASTGTPVLEQTHFRIGMIDVLDNTYWLAAPDTNVLVPSPSCVRVRMQVRASGGNFGPQVYKAIVAENGGGFTELTADPADNLHLGTDQRFVNQDATTVARLDIGGESYISGAWLLAPATAFPAIDFTDPSRSEWVANACIKTGVAPGTFFELCMAQQDGTSVTCTLKPRLTVGAAAAFFQ